jgi:DNA processing protein
MNLPDFIFDRDNCRAEQYTKKLFMGDMDELFYRIALTMLPGIGQATGKKMIAHCGSARDVFRQKKSQLLLIPGVRVRLAKSIFKNEIFLKAEAEIKFIESENILPLFYLDIEYPERLKQCADAPILMYYKGTARLDQQKVLAVVGTRNATNYGKDRCNELINDLSPLHPLIVSGLAYGVDICAHRACLKNNLQTVAVLAHGLDVVYPVLHRTVAERIQEHGGLLCDYTSGTFPDRENFPQRNRIVAGLCDGVVVIESAIDGGSMITAEIANSYSRDVFAFPGRTSDPYSAGCHKLIKENKAALVESAEDIIRMLGWDIEKKTLPVQQKLFNEHSPEEEQVMNHIRCRGEMHIDELCILTEIPMKQISSLLLQLEFSGALRSLPGKRYRLN